jgi:hypothetical protein
MRRDSLRVMKKLATFAVCALLALSGCVAGQTHAFNYVPADRTDVGNGRVVLLFAVDDKRPYVVSGDEPANFVGEMRNGYGMPFNITTKDKRPFAEIVQDTVQRDLEAAGFKVTAADTKAGDIASAVRSASANRALAVVMNEFKSDTYANINFDYGFEAIVYDENGKELAREQISGEDQIDASFMNPARTAREQVPVEFYKKIHGLIAGNRNIMDALTR